MKHYQCMCQHDTIDWEYFVGSKLGWAKYSTNFNLVKLAHACIKITVEVYFVFLNFVQQ